jgi:hypothetical protein
VSSDDLHDPRVPVFIDVEPADGTELDRIVTVLLWVSTAVERIVRTIEWSGRADGSLVGPVAERMHERLRPFAAFFGDEDELELRRFRMMAARAACHLELEPLPND